ncbi:MAG TPA: dicarboxylate/amino acid:cation symporter [Candidatus Angelobacter sp.]|nr:dicarboxylate/amino acid:cation symporter [Candidatus Angelobacter sp.]
MSLVFRVVIGLIVGLLLGLAISSSHSPWLAHIPAWIEPIGTIFVNAIRMAVIPLVVSGIIAGTASARAAAMGSLGRRSLALIFIVLLASGLFGIAVGLPLLSFLHTDQNIVASLTKSAAAPQTAPASYPSIGQWLVDLVPVNVFKAAADGALLPLIVASIAFGLALTQVEAQRRVAVVQFFQGVGDALLAFVGFVVKFAPIGVFALAVPLAARMGIAAFGALGYYIGTYALACSVFTLLILYPAPIVLGRVSLSRFLRAAFAAQAVAFTSRSSLASLPAAYEGLRSGLDVPEDVQNFFLPIAASIFRAGAPMAQMIGVLFLAKLYGVTLGPAQLATVLAAVIATSLTIPGVPGGSIIVMAPVLASANIPVAGVGILLAVDTIPDMFRTVANVTGWLSVGGILGRGERKKSVAAAGG